MLVQLLVNIDVDDVERAVAFYRDALGLRPGRRLFAGSVAEMLGASSPIYLLAKPGGTAPFRGAAAGRSYRRHWTPVHVDFEVADLAAALERARAAGARLEGEVQAFAWGTQATLSDPFGNGFCLIQPTAQGYDAAP
jgi:predicted enzyme related to lactoylglutathione lyase